MKYILLLILSINLCFANGVTVIKKGEQAPEDGFFVTKDQMAKFIQTNEEKKILEQKVITLEKLQVNYETQIEIYKKRLDNTEKELSKAYTKAWLKGVGGFMLGTLATSMAAYAAIKVTK